MRGLPLPTFLATGEALAAAGAGSSALSAAPAAAGSSPTPAPLLLPGPHGAAVPAGRGWLRRSLGASIAEGMLAELVGACAGGSILTGWALQVGFGPAMVGLIGAIPVVSQVFHLPAALLTERIGRRRLSLGAHAASRCAWLLLPAIALLHLPPAAARAVLVATVALSSLFAVAGNNAWVAWMGELVPASMHGRYFGRRTAAATFVGTASALATGVALDRAGAVGRGGEMLTGLSIVAGAAGFGCLRLMARQHERRSAPRPSRAGASLLAPLRDAALRPLLAYQVAWNGAVGIAASFFPLFLLRDLHLGFALVALHAAVTAAFRMLGAPAWGRLIDRVGAAPVLAGCSLAVAVAPLLWLLATPDRLWPLVVDAVATGLLWSGHGLALFGLPLRLAPRDALPTYVGALSSAAGAAFAVAAALAAGLAGWIGGGVVVAGHAFVGLQVLFFTSALARLGAGSLALRLVPARR
jgi:hypothetical protein